MADERTYTAVEHVAILETEVARQTADHRVAREEAENEKVALIAERAVLTTEKTNLLTQIDKLEAEKATAEKATADAEAALVEFKASIERAKEIADLRETRAKAVRAELADIGDEYFTEARTQRWAEMSEEQFVAVLADLAETSAAMKKPKLDANGKPMMDANGKPMMADDSAASEKAARETAAFKGGADSHSSDQSTFMQLMAARRTA